MLSEHAQHLLLANEETSAWPAAPLLEHLTATVLDTARQRLVPRAEQVTAGDPGALDALLHLSPFVI